MADKGDRAAVWRDWPVWVIAAGVLIAVYVIGTGGTPSVLVWLILGFGVVALLVRRGAFTARR
jgi:predicted membrane metal-binding protein